MPVDYADKKPKPKRKPAKRPVGKAKKAASRGGRGSRATTGRRGPQKPPLRLLGLALAIVALFVIALWWLKDNQQPEGPESPILFTDTDRFEQPETGAGSAPATLDALPDAPQERWQYIEELENHSVEVVVPEREESRRRLMQCGSFRSASDAQELRARIAMAGYESQVRQTQSTEHGVWYRVILGPFDGLRPAQTVNNQLRRNNVHGCQIWYWNLD